MVSKRLIGWRGVFFGHMGGSLLGWFLVLIFVVICVPTFTWAYRRHLDALTGPWIANEISRHD
jgi:hypothetical protein